MKKLHVIYNHSIFDEPYKQSEVKKTEKAINDLLGEVKMILSFTGVAAPNPFVYDMDLITVEHSFDMSTDDKGALASILNKGVTKLKRADPIDVVITFRKISEDDLYYFENGKN